MRAWPVILSAVLVIAMCEFDDDISLFSGHLVHGRGSKKGFREILGQRRLVCQHNFGFKRTDDALVRSEARNDGISRGEYFRVESFDDIAIVFIQDFEAWLQRVEHPCCIIGSGGKCGVKVGRRTAYRMETDMRGRNKREPVRERLNKESLSVQSCQADQQCRAIACIANA